MNKYFKYFLITSAAIILIRGGLYGILAECENTFNAYACSLFWKVD